MMKGTLFISNPYSDHLKWKINMVNRMEPKKLEDFFPLCTMNEEKLSKLVARLVNERDEIEQRNRIYYLSEKLEVIFGLINIKASLQL